MKQACNAILTLMLMVLVLNGCRTATHTTVESRTESVEHQKETKVDTTSERTADSVFVMVDRGDSIVRVIERTTHWREKVKVQKDTVIVYVQRDSIKKVEDVREKAKRSPPQWNLTLLSLTLTAALVVAIVLTIKKKVKL